MEPIRILIADDDLTSREILRLFIDMIEEVKIVGEVGSGEELIEGIIKYKPDIALVDIHMPGISGIDAIKMSSELSPSLQVIFTTGFNEFAVEAFNLSAVDYLVKPIERTRLVLAIERARKALKQLNSIHSKKSMNKKISIRSQNTFVYLVVDDIFFIEVEARKSVVHTLQNRFETTETLQEFEEKLPEYFFRTHRSYLVNLRKISRIESSGETFLAFFANYDKYAHISKLKIQEVQTLLTN
jgi:two-component system, LytTR family, response regulator